ncbi:general transcription and DNA repair factor IIH subunit TFB4-like isoform X2 [Rhododendron vialii]|uniref:general transcription and DNA repair factor IIH subunit TFB4-like isoform X2 n=1 Tax=Rhododendron vialii TaxID=182163 RepID=UPI00265EB7F5|nr:general transcription and DNA repair factor IIH subunit TFB4-like isoform X2 [Rhododendron vialii]
MVVCTTMKGHAPYTSYMQVVAFLNSVLLLNQLNQVVVIATSFNTCDYVYNLAAAGALPNQRAKSLLQKLVEFVIKDKQLGKEDSVDGIGSSLLSGSLSMAPCYIQRVFRSGPHHPQPRILCLHGYPDALEQYVAIMNAIFSAQPSMVPIDSCLLGAQHSAFLQQVACIFILEIPVAKFIQSLRKAFLDLFNDSVCTSVRHASYITGGVYMKPQQLDGLFQYLSVGFKTHQCHMKVPQCCLFTIRYDIGT